MATCGAHTLASTGFLLVSGGGCPYTSHATERAPSTASARGSIPGGGRVEARISTRTPPGWTACRGAGPDTLRDVVLVHYARRLLRPRQPPGDGAAEGAPGGGWLARLLAELRRGPTVSRNDIPLAIQAIRLIV